MAEYRYLAEPHPNWANFPHSLPLGAKTCSMNRDHVPIQPEPGLTINELSSAVKTRDGSDYVALRQYRRSGVEEALPVLVYMHGGGFVTGGLETDDQLCRAIAREAGVVVLSVKYRLAPEYPYPHGFEDCLQVVRWITNVQTQSLYNLNPSTAFLLGGTSAGGNFTAALAHAALDEALSPPITGLLFMASSFCRPDVRPHEYLNRILSVDEITDAPGLTVKSIRYFAEKYGAPPGDVRYSPLLRPSREGLARKAFFMVCGWDPRRDEALLFAEMLREGGIEVEEKVYPGLPRGFWTTCPDLPKSARARGDCVGGVGWLLG